MERKLRLSTKNIVLMGCALILAGGLTLLMIFVVVPAVQYARADALAATDPAAAFDAFRRLDNHRSAQARAAQIQADVIASRSAESMEFGGHEWLVMEERGGNAMLLLADVLPARPFHGELVEITWENSDIRGYLNGPFLRSFDEEDRARIVETRVFNHDSADFGTSGGNDTYDYVFLLSLAEAQLYFVNVDERIGRTDARGRNRVWWLRSPGLYPELAATVLADGTSGLRGSGVNAPDRYVRPALWLAMD